MTTPPPPPPPPSSSPTPPPPPPVAAGQTTVGAVGPIGQERGVGITILLTIVTLGIWGMVWTYQNAKEFKTYSGKGLGGGIHLLIVFFIGFLTPFLLASEVEDLYQSDGREPPVSALTGLWILLPFVGGIVWYVKVQQAINSFWATKQ